MIETLRNAWKVKDIRNRIIFTALMFLVFRLGNAIPLPFFNKELIELIMEKTQGSILSLLNMMTGGGLSEMSVFALGVGPYITSSIVVQLLTVAIPKLEELSKEGEEGQQKIQRLTRIVTLVLAFIQGYAIVKGIFNSALATGDKFEIFIATLALVAGSMFLVWIGDLITEKGIGNGTSIIIFAGIVASLPQTAIQWGKVLINSFSITNLLRVIAIVLIALITTFIVILITEGERKIPVQYAKRVVGRKMYGGQNTHIPIKVNMSGVLPVIFASSILALPQTLGLLIGGGFQSFVTKYLTPQTIAGTIAYAIINFILVIFFAYFYNSISFDTNEYAKNLQQYGGFIPGIRPGRPTSEYLAKVVNRITLIGAFVLGVLAISPTILSAIFNLDILFGGTSMIIVVGVILDTVREMEAMLQMRNYEGFLKK